VRLRFTLKGALTVYFLQTACLPLLLAGTALLYFFSATLEKEVTDRNLLMAKTIAGEVSRFLGGHLTVMEYAADQMGDQGPAAVPLPDEGLERLVKRYRFFETIKVLDQAGRIRRLAPFQQDRVGLDQSGHPFVREAMATGKPVWSDAYLSSRTGYPGISLAVPRRFGAVVGDLNLAVLQDITGKIRIGAQGYVAMTDRAGTTIAHPNRTFVTERLNVKDLNIIRRGLAGEEGTFRYRFRGEDKIGSVAQVPETGWPVVVIQPEEEAFAPVKKLKTLLWALTGLSVLVALFIAYYTRRKVISPLSRLVASARGIAGGNYRIDPVGESYPEIEQLAEGFTSMAEAIDSREKALSRSEQRYRNLVEEGFDGIFIHKDGKITFANRPMNEMLGYGEDELLGLSYELVFHGEFRELIRERAAARIRGEQVPTHYEVKLQHKDGSWLYGELSAKVVDVEGGPGIQVWIKDISEHKRAEDGLRLSEKRFKDLYDSVSDLIYTQDLEGRFLSVNRPMTDLFGYQPDEIIGRPVSDFMKPELRPLFETKFLAKIRDFGRHQGISAYFTKDGRKLYIETHSTLVRPGDGEPFISGIGRDMTLRVLAEKSVKEREERIRAIFEASPNPLVVYDTEGHPQFLNPAFTTVFGWTLDEVRGKRIPFVPDDQSEKTGEKIKALYRTGQPVTFEARRLTRDGMTLDVFISAAFVRGAGEEPGGMVVSLTDLTEKKKMEAGLQQARKMEAIGALAAGIAHDFNNLLMGIQGYASLMLVDVDSRHPFHEKLRHIEQYVRQGADLTRQLLGFARGGKYEVQATDLNELIKTHNLLFGRTKKEIGIHEKYEDNLWAVDVDRGQMTQVLMNLYVNAWQAMPAGGDLFVETDNVVLDEERVRAYEVEPGRYVKISVTDTGVGMDETTLRRIFDPFFTTKEGGRGTGLGLASVYGIIKNHGGFIDVYSEKGAGTTFNIYLPASDSVVSDELSVASERKIQKGEGTILLVDDEEMIVDVGKQMLERLGYRVLTAGSGKEAIEIISRARGAEDPEAEAIDLVILDMIMPEIGGGATFDGLKEINPDIRVLLSSGYSINGQVQQILDRGCRGFVQKPFNLKELGDKIKDIMA
jgi:PAS domain S-box-containing protein